ncbi:unnamed protein product [Leuciscus chuanchicus]
MLCVSCVTCGEEQMLKRLQRIRLPPLPWQQVYHHKRKWVMSLRLWDYGPGDVPPPLPKRGKTSLNPMKTMTDIKNGSSGSRRTEKAQGFLKGGQLCPGIVEDEASDTCWAVNVSSRELKAIVRDDGCGVLPFDTSEQKARRCGPSRPGDPVNGHLSLDAGWRSGTRRGERLDSFSSCSRSQGNLPDGHTFRTMRVYCAQPRAVRVNKSPGVRRTDRDATLEASACSWSEKQTFVPPHPNRAGDSKSVRCSTGLGSRICVEEPSLFNEACDWCPPSPHNTLIHRRD